MNKVEESKQQDVFFVPFETFLKRYKTRPKSYELYKYLLGPFFKWLKANSERNLTNFDDRDVETYLAKADTLRRSTKVQLLVVLRRFVNVYRTHMIPREDHQAWQVHGMRIERMKSMNITIPPDESLYPKQMALSLEELDNLMEVASRNKEQFLLLYIYGYFGLRVGERKKILRVDWDKNELEIRTEKTHVPRILYFDDTTKRLLKEALKLEVLGRGYGYIYKRFKELSGLFIGNNRLFSPHTMRHTFRTWMKNKTKDDSVVDALMGHKKRFGPYIYDHVFEGEKRRAMTELHYFNDLKFLKRVRTEWSDTSERP